MQRLLLGLAFFCIPVILFAALDWIGCVLSAGWPHDDGSAGQVIAPQKSAAFGEKESERSMTGAGSPREP